MHDGAGVVKAAKQTSIRMEFEDNGTLARLTGEHNQNLARLEQALDVSLDSFGNNITISGPASAAPSPTATQRNASLINDPSSGISPPLPI